MTLVRLVASALARWAILPSCLLSWARACYRVYLVERQSLTAGSLKLLALAGRQAFETFDDVIRHRRIHRQKGVDPYKESTMRLRDGAITVEDYELWQTHEVPSLDPREDAPWLYGERC